MSNTTSERKREKACLHIACPLLVEREGQRRRRGTMKKKSSSSSSLVK